MHIHCTNCDAVFDAADLEPGLQFECGACGGLVTVPRTRRAANPSSNRTKSIREREGPVGRPPQRRERSRPATRRGLNAKPAKSPVAVVVISVVVLAAVAGSIVVLSSSGSDSGREGGFSGTDRVGGHTLSQWMGLLGNSVKSIAVQAAKDLAGEGQAAVPVISRCLKEGDSRVREHAAIAATHIGRPAAETVPALLEALNDPQGRTKAVISLALARIAPDNEAAIRGIGRALRQTRGDDRACVFGDIQRLGPLKHLLVADMAAVIREKEEERVRCSIIMELGDMGAVARDAIPALQEVSRDASDRMAAYTAREALEKVQGSVLDRIKREANGGR